MAKENNRSSYFGDVVKKFLAHRLAMMGTIVLLIEVLAVLLLPAIMKLDPYSMDYMAFGGGPSPEHILGCDDVGRDLFARLIFGGRVSLMVGMCLCVRPQSHSLVICIFLHFSNISHHNILVN